MPDQTVAEFIKDLVSDVASEEMPLEKALSKAIAMGRQIERNRTQLLLKAQFFDG